MLARKRSTTPRTSGASTARSSTDAEARCSATSFGLDLVLGEPLQGGTQIERIAGLLGEQLDEAGGEGALEGGVLAQGGGCVVDQAPVLGGERAGQDPLGDVYVDAAEEEAHGGGETGGEELGPSASGAARWRAMDADAARRAMPGESDTAPAQTAARRRRGSG